MRRILIAAGVAVALFATVAFAAGSFNVHTSLGSGSVNPIGTCTTDVDVDYLLAWDDALDGFKVTDVMVTTSHAACNGLTATAELTGAGGFGIGSVSGPIAGLTTGWLNLNPDLAVVVINDVHVVIH